MYLVNFCEISIHDFFKQQLNKNVGVARGQHHDHLWALNVDGPFTYHDAKSMQIIACLFNFHVILNLGHEYIIIRDQILFTHKSQT